MGLSLRNVVYLAGAVLALGSGGCLLVVAGTAGGVAAAGYAYSRGNVCQSYHANLNDVWSATHVSLAELGMPVLEEQRATANGWIRTRSAEGDAIRINVEVEANPVPAEGVLTTVCVRVATFGDEPTSGRILDQVNAHLVAPRPGAIPPPTPQGTAAPVVQPLPPSVPQTIEPPVSPAAPPPPPGGPGGA